MTNGVTYSSSNTSVAIVNETTGEVTLVAAGETTITATAVADATYKAGTASYTLTVSAGSQGGETPDPETPDETKYYVKVTTSTPGAGTYLYVLDKGFVFTGDVSDNSWGKSEAVTITDNKIEATEAINAYAITLEEGTTSGQYAVKLPNGNYLVTTTQKPTSSSTASYMTYDTTEGLCSVDNSDYYFHGNTSSNSFRWYKLSSNQNAGQLYKLN